MKRLRKMALGTIGLAITLSGCASVNPDHASSRQLTSKTGTGLNRPSAQGGGVRVMQSNARASSGWFGRTNLPSAQHTAQTVPQPNLSSERLASFFPGLPTRPGSPAQSPAQERLTTPTSGRSASSALASRSPRGSVSKENSGELARFVIQGSPVKGSGTASGSGEAILPVALEVKVYSGADGEPTATLVADSEHKPVARESSSSAARDRVSRHPSRRGPLLARQAEEPGKAERPEASVASTDSPAVSESQTPDAPSSEVVFNSIRELSAADPLIALAEDLADKEPAELPRVTVDQLETVEHTHSHSPDPVPALLTPGSTSHRDDSPMVISESPEVENSASTGTETPAPVQRGGEQAPEDWAVPSYLRHRQDEKSTPAAGGAVQGQTHQHAHQHSQSQAPAAQRPLARPRAGWLPNPLKPLRHLFGRGGGSAFEPR